MARRELEEKLAVLLGGRVAEYIVYGEFSTGAADGCPPGPAGRNSPRQPRLGATGPQGRDHPQRGDRRDVHGAVPPQRLFCRRRRRRRHRDPGRHGGPHCVQSVGHRRPTASRDGGAVSHEDVLAEICRCYTIDATTGRPEYDIRHGLPDRAF